jgi:hypothetical protein
MINKIVLLLSALLIARTSAFSQVTITQADFPMVDMAGMTGNDTSSFISPGTTGASQTWDFSSFVPSRTDTSYLKATTFAGNPLFPAATFSSCGVASGFSVCSYGYINTTGLFLVGAEQNISVSGMAIHNIVTMEPNNQVNGFPFTYSNTRTSAYVQRQLAIYTPATTYDSTRTMYHRTVNQVCDGWGTLITPYGSYNALRMQQIQTNIDTTYNHTSGGAWTFGAARALSYDTSYTWFAPGIGSVATIGGRAPRRYTFYKQGAVSGIAAAQTHALAVFPNPVNETLNICNAGIGTMLQLYDITGRLVHATTVNASSCSIDMSACQPGLYLLQVTDVSGNRVVEKISRQ